MPVRTTSSATRRVAGSNPAVSSHRDVAQWLEQCPRTPRRHLLSAANAREDYMVALHWFDSDSVHPAGGEALRLRTPRRCLSRLRWRHDRVAQQAERRPDTPEVAGSSPASITWSNAAVSTSTVNRRPTGHSSRLPRRPLRAEARASVAGCNPASEGATPSRHSLPSKLEWMSTRLRIGRMQVRLLPRVDGSGNSAARRSGNSAAPRRKERGR